MFFLRFFLALILVGGWVGVGVAQEVMLGIENIGPDNELEYKMSFKKSDIGASGTDDFRLFWYFGDGYHELTLLTGMVDEQVTFSVVHGFDARATGNDFGLDKAFIEVTAIYTDEHDDPKIGTGTPNSFPSSFTSVDNDKTVSGYGAPIHLKYNRDFVKGDPITLIFPFIDDCERSTTLIVRYNSNHLEPENFPTLSQKPSAYGTGISNVIGPNTVTINEGGVDKEYEELKVDVTPNGNYTQYIYVPLQVAEDAPLQPEEPIDLQLLYEYYPVCEKDLRRELNIPLGTLLKGSHDPNSLSSTQADCHCSEEDSIRYVIKYQNIGKAPADVVYIKNIIPSIYDINSIEVLHPLDGGVGPPVESSGNSRELMWTIRDDFLRGGDTLKGAGDKSVLEYETIDSLVYLVAISNCDSFNNCDAIPNQAEIIFDCNPPIYTNPDFVRFGCDTTNTNTNSFPLPLFRQPIADLSPDTCNCTEQYLVDTAIAVSDSVFMGQTLFSDISSQEEYAVRWYPSTLVEDPTDFNSPIISQKSRSFFRVYTKNDSDSCSRIISESIVLVDCLEEIDYEIICQGTRNILRAWVVGNTEPLNWSYCSDLKVTFSMDVTNIGNLDIPLYFTNPRTNCSNGVRVNLTEKEDCRKKQADVWMMAFLIFADLAFLILAIFLIGRLFRPDFRTENEETFN